MVSRDGKNISLCISGVTKQKKKNGASSVSVGKICPWCQPEEDCFGIYIGGMKEGGKLAGEL